MTTPPRASEVLRALAAGRREYAEGADRTDPDYLPLVCQAEAFEAAASLLDGTSSAESLTSAFVPSWRWHTYEWMPEFVPPAVPTEEPPRLERNEDPQ